MHGWDREMAEPLELELENGVSEKRDRESAIVITTGDIHCYYINITASSTKIQLANQCHGYWVTCRALTPDIHYCFIITVEQYLLFGPLVAPCVNK